MITKKDLQLCAQLCVNTYNGRFGDKKPCFDDFTKFVNGDVEGGYGVDTISNTLYVVYKGSDSIQDWLDNLDIKLVQPNDFSSNINVKVHKGFLKQYNEIKNFIEKLCLDYDNIVFIGHSLGGALAVLSAYNLISKFNSKIIKCVTLGCPKVGNRAFAKYFNSRNIECLHVVNTNDLVTKVPPLFWLYNHVGKKVWVNNNGLNQFQSIVKHPILSFFGDVLDHYPQKYLSAIQKLKNDFEI